MTNMCNICGSKNINVLFNLKGTNEFSIVNCNKCGVRFLSPIPSEKILNNIYTERYYKSWGISGENENPATKKMKIATFKHRIELIKKYKKGGKILDIGCATGFFLEAAQKEGYKPFGVELSEYSAKLAKKKFDDDVIFHGRLEEANYPNKHFDVIAMSDLLEHVSDPTNILNQCSQLLNDDGIIIITTPDTDSLSAKLMGRYWVHYKLEHLFYFNTNSIKKIAGLHGFKVASVERAKKALNLSYANHQFNVYTNIAITPLLNILSHITPKKIFEKNFNITLGEMVVILKKIN